MARTIAQIQQSIIDAKDADAALTGLTSTSKVAIWRLWTWVIATCHWMLESLYDAHKAEVAAMITADKKHTLQWYVTMSKAFQYTDALVDETDTYAVIDETKQIVAFAAAIEFTGYLRIKVAKINSGVLEKLASVGELPTFEAYMGRIKDAGVRLLITSGDPDDLRLGLGIYYDPLIFDNTGARLDGTATTPVQDAINNFLKNMPFNGLFVLNYLIVALQEIEGVRIGQVNYCAARYGANPYADIDREYNPDAGYMKLDDTYFLANTTYTAHGPI